MKKIYSFAIALLLSAIVSAQTPQKISYQAVARDAQGQLITNQTIDVSIAILQGTSDGNPVYIETHEVMSNANGLFSLSIGTGTPEMGSLDIDWTKGPYFIATAVDLNNNGGFDIVGVSELMSVPYAFHSNTADSLSRPISASQVNGLAYFTNADEKDPMFKASVAAQINANDTTNWNNKLSREVDPMFKASVASKIMAGDTTKWNNKISIETDPIFKASIASSISANDTTKWNKKLSEEVDPLFSSSVAAQINTNDTTKWNNKISEEVDPLFSASIASSISAADTAKWNNPSSGSSVQNLSLVNDTLRLSGSDSIVALPFGPAIADSNDLLTYDGTNWVAKSATTSNVGSNQSFNNMQPYLVLNYQIALVGIYPSRNGTDPYVAEIMLFAGNFTVRGYAACDGQLLPISQNQALFSLVGTTYGGDGRTTFGLPDLRGRTAIHKGSGPGLTNRPIGQKSGTETTTLSTANLPAHNHEIIYITKD